MTFLRLLKLRCKDKIENEFGHYIINGCVQQNVYFATVGSFLRADWIMLLEEWFYLSNHKTVAKLLYSAERSQFKAIPIA